MKGQGGQIIVVGSGVGHRVVDDAHSAYGAAKAGAWMFVRALAAELRPYNICVNELIPGSGADGDHRGGQSLRRVADSALSGSSSPKTFCRWRSSWRPSP